LRFRRLLTAAAAVVTALGFAGPAGAGLPPTMAGIGDSLTTAWGSLNTGRDFKPASWSTGTDPNVNSHRKRIEAAAGGGLKWVKNYAVTGTFATELPRQAAQVPVGTAYVTVSAGTTELCSVHIKSIALLDARVDLVEGNIRRTLRILFSRNPQAKVLVMSVPNWYDLWQNFQGNAAISSAWGNIDICPLLLQEEADTIEGAREAIDGSTQFLNGVLEAVCAEFANCRFDGNSVYNDPWAEAEISLFDGFHFSRTGENSVAGLTWNAGWYAGVTGPFDDLELRILVNRVKLVTSQRVQVSLDTFPGASLSVVVRNRAGTVIGRTTGGANGDGDFVRRIALTRAVSFAKVTMIARWDGQTARAVRKIRR
jgi:lysophospholipase L1-like esterase